MNTLAAKGPRRYPIDREQVTPPWIYDGEFRVTLPEGWHARLPPGQSLSSAFGSYRAQYTQEGRVVRVVRHLIGSRGIAAPERMPEVIDWIRSVSRDDIRFLVLEHATP